MGATRISRLFPKNKIKDGAFLGVEVLIWSYCIHNKFIEFKKKNLNEINKRHKLSK